MDREFLKAISRDRSATLASLRSNDRRTFARIVDTVAADRRTALASAFEGAPDRVAAEVGRLDDEAVASGDIVSIGRRALEQAELRPSQRAELEARVNALAALDPGGLDLEKPIADSRALSAALATADVLRLGEIADVGDAGLDALVDAAASPVDLEDQDLDDLVASRRLGEQEADRLASTLSLYHLAEGDIDVAERLAGARFASLRGGLTNVRDILRIPREELAASFGRDGRNGKETAARLVERAEAAFPSEAMRRRLAPVEPDRIRGSLESASRVLAANVDRFGEPVEALDLRSVPAPERDRAAAAYRDVVALAGRYHGLGVDRIIRSGASADQMARDIAARTTILERVFERNPDVEFLTLDFAPDSDDLRSVDFAGLGEEDRRAVITNLSAQQRTFAVARDADTSTKLLEGGYLAATSIAAADVKTLRARTGLSESVAQTVHARAREAAAGVSTIMGSIISILGDRLGDRIVGNLREDVSDGLRKMQGYADLFGPIDNCSCEHCSSILSPAAYFVDLMYFVEEHVSSKVFLGALADHALHLKVRRPDLWSLELTCDNTHTLIPTLDVVNEVLASYIASRRQPGLDLSDRAAVHADVFGDALVNKTDSFHLPLVLATETADAYTQMFDVTRADLLRLMALPEERVTAASLALTSPLFSLITQENTDLGFLRSLFAVNFAPGAGGVIAAVDVQAMLRSSGMSREQLGDMVESRFVSANGTAGLALRAEKSSPQSVQNDVERLTGLTVESLDRLHRMIRLQRASGLSVRELDLILLHHAGDRQPVASAGALSTVAATRSLAARFGVPIDVATALWSVIPQREIIKGRGSLLDRLFNVRPYAQSEGVFPKLAESFVLPSMRLAPAAGNDNTLNRLLLGLQLGDADLAALVRGLAAALGVDPVSGVESDRGVVLSLENLSLLYRHAQLARLLRRPVADLVSLLRMSGVNAVQDRADLEALLAFDAWVRGSGLKLDEIIFMTEGAPVPPGAPEPGLVASALVQAVQSDEALIFADTIFAFVPGVTEADSRRIAALNAGLFDDLGEGRLRLAGNVAPNFAVTAPAGMTVSPADLTAAVAPFHSASVLPPRLAAALGVTADTLAELLAMANVDPGAAGVVTALHGGDAAPLEQAIGQLLKLTTAFGAKAFTAARLAFVRANPGVFAIGDFNQLDLTSARRLTAYKALIAPASPLAGRPAPAPEAVDEALSTFTPGNKFQAMAPARLAAALGAREEEAVLLSGAVTMGDEAIAALGTLASVFSLMNTTGFDVPLIQLLTSDSAGDHASAAEALVSALARRYPDADDQAARLEPEDDRLRSRKRDAEADFIIRTSEGRFEVIEDLYDYFLIDTQLQGCARTSHVVAAISSVQAYVHRVLLNLEQDRRDIDHPRHVHVTPDMIPGDEWFWRKNYRVWEANRKVFLWPENYIEPDLRDDKSPLFKALEEGLLQQDITEQNVLDAYGGFLGGFEEATNVTIAGAYHEFNASANEDVVHVFGATPDDPPVYYYWTIHNFHASLADPDERISYSARRKVDASIPVRRVTPVVYLGRLYVFWMEISTSSHEKVEDGESRFIGYKHKTSLKYISLRLDGRWTTPQEIDMAGTSLVNEGGVVYDPLISKGQGGSARSPWFSADYSSHSAFREGYTLEGPHWTRPAVQPIWNDRLMLNSTLYLADDVADLFDRRLRKLPEVHEDWLRFFWYNSRRLLHVGEKGQERRLYAPFTTQGKLGLSSATLCPSAFQNIVADIDHARAYFTSFGNSEANRDVKLDKLRLSPGKRGPRLATLRDGKSLVQGVGGAPSGTGIIIERGGDAMYVIRNPDSRQEWLALRIGTTMVSKISRTLFMGGVDQLLDVATQKGLGEGPHLLKSLHRMQVKGLVGSIDFTGPLGVYYRELFFHIPALIADSLNARGNFRAAQSWYHYIFDPTATRDPGVRLEDLSPSARRSAMRDRVWRYIEFRGLTPPKMRSILTDDQTIEAYKKDPFNPHAIARLRLSAYQKSIVMKYVSNLIDWGDSLFRQFTMESVNEANVLYAVAAQILGRGPADVGECGEGAVSPKSYEKIRPWVERGSEFLQEVENVYWIGPRAKRFRAAKAEKGARLTFKRSDAEITLDQLTRAVRDDQDRASSIFGKEVVETVVANPIAAASKPDAKALVAHAKLRESVAGMDNGGRVSAAARLDITRDDAVSMIDSAIEPATSKQFEWNRARTTGWVDRRGAAGRLVGNDDVRIAGFGRVGRFSWSIVRQLGPIFCVPQNKDLVELWRRVDDRLYKIRHCLDIEGNRRSLALFAPEIDPRLLVKARAAGLSIEDVLGAGAGDLPPYRFTFLIEKAKEFVGVVQGFGSQLQGALERRDAEELSRLRTVQAANVLKLSRNLRQSEIQIARDASTQLARQKSAIEYRRNYYAALEETDLIPTEIAQQVMRHGATAFHVLGALFGGTAGVLSLIPQLGSPFAMKYGGHELDKSMKGWSMMFSDTAKLMEIGASSAGLEASFARRREGWAHQRELADHELKQLEKQIDIADIRLEMAERNLEIHDQNVEDLDETLDFFESKFSNIGLYTYLATSLQRLYREAFNNAQSMAKLAERAYRFERDDETTSLLEPTYWSSEHAGLLSGERLLTDLVEMERRFIETNYRTLEVDQSFSLMQLSPQAMMRLRETGTCDVEIPEYAFDLMYPGQYRRRIKSVRMTMPCVTGPYTNVAATLTMTGSSIRRKPQPAAAELVDMPLRHTNTIATSTAQNDAGVFDFSFRDERYMPFEGAGTVSRWTITLPSTFRTFDYNTITDVILHISYTASQDGVLRETVEDSNTALEGSLATVFSTQPLARAISLRQEFSSLYNRAMNGAAGAGVVLEIDRRFLPYFLRAHDLNLGTALLLIKPASGLAGAGFAASLNGASLSGFVDAPQFPGYRQVDARPALAAGLIGQHAFSIDAGGDLAPDQGPGVVDPAKLQDMVLYVEVTM